jgi:hypothetical protein
MDSNDDDTDDSTPSIRLSKDNPLVAQMFSDCQPGDEINLTLGYNDKVLPLKAVVGEDDDQEFTATIAEPGDSDTTEEGGEAGAGAGASPDGDDGASSGGGVGAGTPLGASAALGAPPVNSAADYIKSKRK